MATVNIKFFRAAILNGGNGAAIGADLATPEVFTSSSSSQSTTASAPDNNTYVRIVSTGGDVWITRGENPTAVTNSGDLIVNSVPEYFKLEAGHKIALID